MLDLPLGIHPRPLVYIAGPYASDPVGNTRLAKEVWHLLADRGIVGICPHVSLYLDMHRHRPPVEWYIYDAHLLQKCDYLLRIHGESQGADYEVRFARHHRIKVIDLHTAEPGFLASTCVDRLVRDGWELVPFANLDAPVFTVSDAVAEEHLRTTGKSEEALS